MLLAALLAAACEPSASLSGPATVIDGDSLEIRGVSIRLFGVDAFEGRQSCARSGKEWRCGEAATLKLEELVGTAAVACQERDIDRYGRTVAVCTNGTVDLAAELARAGLALAYRQYSSDYVDEEAEAEEAQLGAWAGNFEAPWDWRQRSTEDSTESYGLDDSAELPLPALPVPDDCLMIKGNINSEGERIYHLSGSPYYEATIIDESRDERWFCSEAEARAAGWRESLAR